MSINGASYDDSSALASAVHTRNHQMVEQILTSASRDRKGKLHSTHLCFGHKALFEAAANSDQEMIEKLLNSGMNLGPECLTQVLWEACGRLNLPLIQYLLSIGASPNPEIAENKPFMCKEFDYENSSLENFPTPLWIAMEIHDKEAVQLLIDSGVDPCRLGKGYTALCYAISCSQLDVFDILLQTDVDVNQPASTSFMRTALQKAAECGKMDVVDRLLQTGADIHQAPAIIGGVTALQAAAIGGFLGIVGRFLELGEDANALGAEREGRTALEGAAEHGRIDTVQLLLNAGADVSSTPFGVNQYKQAVKLAREGHNVVARLIIRHRESLK